MGHLAEQLAKGWGILTAKIPLTYMLNAQQISIRTHTLNKFLFYHTHVQGHFVIIPHVDT